MNNLGFLAALGAAVCWGTYMVPFKRSGHPNVVFFQALMAIGIGLSGLAISLILGYPISLNLYGLLSGVLWAVGNTFGLMAISNLGLSRAVPLMSSLVVILSFLWGALAFGEIPTGMAVGFLGIGLIVAGVILVSSTENMESRNIRKGLLAGICAGLIWGSQLVPIKFGNVSTGDFFFSVCLGIFISGLTIFVFKKVKFQKEIVNFSLLSGLIWNVGNLLSLIAVSLIGLSKAGPVSQAAIVVAVFWGLVYFKEVNSFKSKLRIALGAVVLLSGVATLGFA